MAQPREDVLRRLFEIYLIRDTILGNLWNVYSLEDVQAVVSLRAIGALQKEDLKTHFRENLAKIRDDSLFNHYLTREMMSREEMGVGDLRPEYVPEKVYKVARKGLAARKVLQSWENADDVTTSRKNGSSEDMHQYLVFACAAGMPVDEVKKLCTLAEWSQQDQNAHLPMIMAASYGHLEIVIFFYNPNQGYCWIFEAFLLAVANGHLDVARFLLEDAVHNLDAMNSDEKTALMLAAEGGHTEIVRMLLETKTIDVDFQGDWDELYDPGLSMTALMFAAVHGHGDIVRLLLESGKVNVEIEDRYKRTALMYASIGGNVQVFNTLFGLGKVDLNSKDEFGYTALIYASQDGHTDIVRLLLESREVDVNMPQAAFRNHHDVYDASSDDDGLYGYDEGEYRLGQTPIMFAATNGHLDIVKLLFEADDIDLTKRDRRGMSLLAHGMTTSHAHVAEFLIKSGKFDLNEMDVTGNTPLMHASQWGLGQVVKVLLESGKVDANLKSPCGKTALAYALEYENVQAFKVLLESEDVNVNSKDSEGKTILIHASIMGNSEMARLLLEHGKVDIHIEDYEQKNALTYAAENDYSDIVSLLEHKMSLV